MTKEEYDQTIRDFAIISGHTRRLAALKLGLDEVPVLVG